MKAKDIMTTDVVTVGPDATVREIASLMCDHRISGMPVIEDGRIVGIVSEGDLIRRREIDSIDRPGAWQRFLGDATSAQDYIKSHATRVADVMTTGAITVQEETPLAEIARIFEKHHIKRVPVMRGEQLVGLVSRANLIQALAGTSPPVAESNARDDLIRQALMAELASQPWWRAWHASPTVRDGVVHFWGFYMDVNERDAARIAAENIPGVKSVEDHRNKYSELVAIE